MVEVDKGKGVSSSADQDVRRDWMGLLARAGETALEEALGRLAPGLSIDRDYSFLRRPETGLVMVRGRAGGDGRAFNLGEMSVTRCSVRLTDGTVGHAYVAGRSARHAELAAVFDGLLQTAEAPRIRDGVIEPLRRGRAADRARGAAKTAATRVDFFTLVREQE